MQENLKKNSISFLGKGFGLYGYMHSFDKKNKFCTLLKYKKFIKSRNDLKTLKNNISYYKTEKELICRSDTIVFAKRPLDQEKFIKKIIKNKNFHKKLYFLEKPLARDPIKSIKILKLLKKKKIKINIGYLFPFLNKISRLNNKSFKKCFIKWNFFSYTLKNKNNNWKLIIKEGGGPIRFYGIQIIALICKYFKVKKIKYSNIIFNNKRAVRWTAEIYLNGNKELFVDLNLKSEVNSFVIKYDKSTMITCNDLFRDKKKYKDKFDYRIPFLKKMIKTNSLKNNYNYFLKTLILWQKIENKSKFLK